MPSLQSMKSDLFGGTTAAVVALPLALAFGVSSGAGALAGLYGAIAVGFFAALFGGTPSQISGPTGPMTVVMAAVITVVGGNLGTAFLVVSLAGLIQIGFGIARVGRYIKLVPQPVVSGFMSGIGVIVIILQLAPFLGHDSPDGTTLVKLVQFPAMLADPDGEAVILGALSFGLMWLTPRRLALLIPSSLVAIFVGTLVGYFWLSDAPVIGEIPSGLPTLHFPSLELDQVSIVVRYALVLAFLGSIDSLLTSLVADSITRQNHDSNRELIGQGIGNTVAGLLGGIPGAGATMRTLVNIRAGGKTRHSGMIHAIVLLAIVLVFSDLASHIPLAVLAGILLKVGLDIIDWRSLRRLNHTQPAAIIIMLSTLGITVFVDLITAVAVGIIMASLLFVARMADSQVESAKIAFGSDQGIDLNTDESEILDQAQGRIVLFHIEGPLSFGSARDISWLMQQRMEKDALVVDLTDVPFIDSSATAALEEVIERLQECNDAVFLFGVRPRVMAVLGKAGIPALLGKGEICQNRLQALQAAQAYITQEVKP